jgi:hypothetical protein
MLVIAKLEMAFPFADGVTLAAVRLHPIVAFVVAQVKPTVAVNPFNDETVTVEVVEPPILIVPDGGVRERPKSMTPRLKVAW